MLKRSVFAVIFAAALISASAFSAHAQKTSAPALKTYVLADGNFSVDLPSEPVRRTIDKDGITTDEWIVESNDGFYQVSTMSFSTEDISTLSVKQREDVILSFFTGIVQGMTDTGIDEADLGLSPITDVTYAGMKGKEQSGSVSGLLFRYRGFAGKDRFYFFAVLPTFDDAEFGEKVLSSFKLIGPKAK